jgi:hypothetical protein
MRKLALTGVVILVVAVAILVVGVPRIRFVITGEPVIDCGPVRSDICAELYREAASSRMYGDPSSPVILFRLRPAGGTGPPELSRCNQTTVERLNGEGGIGQPLC